MHPTDASTLIDNTERNRFELHVGDDVAFLDYVRDGERLALVHTEVPVVLRGGGVGSDLVRAVLERARADGARIVPSCGFVRAFLRRHPDYADMVDPPASA